MKSELFQRVVDGYADTPHERALALVLATDEEWFVTMWQEAWDAEHQPIEVTNWPTTQTSMEPAEEEKQQQPKRKHNIRMSGKRRKEMDAAAPPGYLVCSSCTEYKPIDRFSFDNTKTSLDDRGRRRSICKACQSKGSTN